MRKPSMTQGNPEALASEKESLSAVDVDSCVSLNF